MSSFLAELPGTALLIALGDGVVASVLFGMAKCDATGWGVITTSWMLAVAFVVYAVSTVRRGRTTSEVSIAFAVLGQARLRMVTILHGCTVAWGLGPGAWAGHVAGEDVLTQAVHDHETHSRPRPRHHQFPRHCL